MHYAWLLWSALLLLLWLAIYLSLKDKKSRKEMFMVSVWTSALGLTEPLFVPAYWNPPSLFNLAQTTGFDIESILFAFGMGGIAVVIYEKIFRVRHETIAMSERHAPRHRYHLFALISAPIIFIVLFVAIDWNPIYSTFIALMGGGLATWYCRPDLKKKMLASAFIFLGLYFIYFLPLTFLYPRYVEEIWNLSALSGILIAGVPLEELMFAFGVGFLWSSIYEHVRWRRVEKVIPTPT